MSEKTVYVYGNLTGDTILSIESNYVPKMMCPKDDGYGDYIIMDIDENGKIDKWKFSLDGFEEED